MAMPHYNEAHALSLLAAGDEKGLILIYEKYEKTIFKIALNHLGSPDAARDVLQEVFCNVWKLRDTITRVDDFRGYLVQMCHFTALQCMKKIVKRKIAENEFVKERKAAFEEDNVLFHMLNLEYPDLVRRVLAKLSGTQKRIYELVTFEGLTYKAAAEQLSVPLQTVRNSMSLAIKSIKHQLSLYILSAALIDFYKIL